MSRDIEALVASMTIDEKASLTAGASTWSTAAIARLGIPEVFVCDGPAGARGPLIEGVGEQVRSLNIPCGSALGATWNPALLEQLGDALGDQTRTKACRVLLAPTVNLHRAPLAGRNFESYSEDPLLTGKLAAAFVRGVQSHGVATTVKHFAGNEAEFERMTIDSVIDERALRELYLLPFELAVREGGALGIMTSYNRLNGRYNAENRELLHDILRGEWGFEGFVVTDWFAGGTAAGAADAGLDLEMPGPARFYGRKLGQAVHEGLVAEHLLDGAASRLLSVFDRIGALDDEELPPIAIDRAEHRALARQAAAESMVLLKNQGVLPLQLSDLRTIAVIGPNAERARIMGGGSAQLQPHYRISPLEALHARLGEHVTIVHEPGCDIDRTIAPISATQLDNGQGGTGFLVEVFAGNDCDGDVVHRTTLDDGKVLLLPGIDPTLPRGPIAFRATSSFTPTKSGPHIISMLQLGSACLSINGNVIFDGITHPTPRGDAYFGLARKELTAEIPLRVGERYELDIEFVSTERSWMQGVEIGCKPVPDPDMMDRAVAAAATADAVIVIVGTNNDWETEGHDRDTLDLPGRQAELIRRVSRANPNTVIVVNAGAPITTDWAVEAPAVLQAWFGGQEMSNALVEVLFGDTDPAGRLPTTFPTCIEHTPSFGNFPGEHGQVRYGEGVLMGYRWYETRKLPVSFAFGHGLSYTSFALGTPTVSAVSIGHAQLHTGAGTIDVSVQVTNTGTRRGAEVVQCYVGAVDPVVVRPLKELKAFQKVWLEPGETTEVTLTLDARSFSYWDPGNAYRGDLNPSPIGLFTDVPESPRGWRIDPGSYCVHIGRSSADIAHTTNIEVTE
ncbi:unannotated protein [freshwater metagenome]|uniref:Unannotated protein n=1 Tax=freshwater metagenome TaxID=449393 RepID=A0A6J7CMV6_9ZZZZ|nr:beta-glucosidase [Actinomycetota bacterium]